MFFDDVGKGFGMVYDKVSSPFVKAENRVERLLDKGEGAVEGVLGGIEGLGSLFSNPMAWAAVGVGAFVILPKLLK